MLHRVLSYYLLLSCLLMECAPLMISICSPAVCGESSRGHCPWSPRKSSRNRRKDKTHQESSSSPPIDCCSWGIAFTSDSIASPEPEFSREHSTGYTSFIRLCLLCIQALGLNIILGYQRLKRPRRSAM